MRISIVTGIALLAVLAGAGGAWAKDEQPKPPAREPGRLLVRFADGAAAGAVSALGDQAVASVPGHVVVVRLHPGRTVDQGLAAYRGRPGVVYAEPNYVASADLAAPNDPSFGSQWGPGAIEAVAGWALSPGSYTGSGGPPIAIVDTGVYAGHPDLAAHVQTSLGANCLSGACNASLSSADNYGHGTHVAGIAAAVTNNAVGVAGIAIASPIIPVKVLDSSGNGSYASIASGILWAAAHGARVINLSLGGTGYSRTLCDAVSTAVAGGAVVVAAAGNSGSSQASYPAACPGAVGVAATDSTGGSPSWSNYGSPDVFVSAPGASIYSTMWPKATISGCAGLLYCNLQGTSMASPFVAGLAALLVGQKPGLTPAGVKLVLAETAQKISATRYAGKTYGADPYGTCTGCTWHPYFGYGQIDAAAALASTPHIASFAPLAAARGSAVTITGSGFAGATAVSLGLVPTTYTVDSPTQITATIPAGVAYGRWRVSNVFDTGVSDLVGSVPLPTITGISAQYGAPGSTVTITGSGFSDVSAVTLGFVPVAAYTVTSPTSIVATVPAGLDYGRFRVTTPVGTSAGATVFSVFAGTPSGLTFSTLSGPAGSTVTLSGTGFSGAGAVSLGFVPAVFTIGSAKSLSATVPAGVSYGRWRVETSGGTLVSNLIFSIPMPVLTRISSPAGPTGTTVTLTGTDFRSVSGVSLGNIPVSSYTVDSPTTIRATVPVGLAYGRWRVETDNGTAVSDVVYTVTG